MKYCTRCGAEIYDEASICTNCGCLVNGKKGPLTSSSSDSYNALAIVGFVLSFFTTIVGLILSIIAYKQTKESGEKGKELALAGIIISSVLTAIVIFVAIIYLWLFVVIFSIAGGVA